MASGGARNRSGPAPDPLSGRSERRGLVFTALPVEGYKGRAPRFPLVLRDDPVVAKREAELWRWAWKTPQAAAWAAPGQRWRWHAVAMWVRTAVVCESSDATAADKNSLHRFADQIGLTPAGLAENGWAIAKDELAEKRAEPKVASGGARDRLRVIGNA